MRRKRKMRKRIDYYTLTERVKEIPIIQVFDRYIGGKLLYRGNKALAQCPWHGSDTSPSLTLYLNRNNWFCFGCQSGKSTIDMVIKVLDIDFLTAVKTLARDFGLADLPANPEIKRKIDKAKERREVEAAFQIDFDRIFCELCLMQSALVGQLQSYEDYVNHPESVFWLPVVEGILDDMTSQEPELRMEGWRLARKVFPWLKTT